MKLRVIGAVAVLVSAYVHLKLWFDGFRHEDVVGPAFMLNAIAGVVIAIMLLTWQHWIPAFLTLGFGLSTLCAFTIATTPMGLFGVHERWVGTYTWMAAISEAIAIVVGGVLLAEARSTRSAEQTQHRQSV